MRLEIIGAERGDEAEENQHGKFSKWSVGNRFGTAHVTIGCHDGRNADGCVCVTAVDNERNCIEES